MRMASNFNHDKGIELKQENDTGNTLAHAESHYVGPIPTAEEFQRYKEVREDMPDRILTVFEKDSENVRQARLKAIEGSISFDKRGQWMGFGIILLGFASTTALSYWDKDAAAIVAAIGTLAFVFKGVFAKNQSGDE